MVHISSQPILLANTSYCKVGSKMRLSHETRKKEWIYGVSILSWPHHYYNAWSNWELFFTKRTFPLVLMVKEKFLKDEIPSNNERHSKMACLKIFNIFVVQFILKLRHFSYASNIHKVSTLSWFLCLLSHFNQSNPFPSLNMTDILSNPMKHEVACGLEFHCY